MNAVPREVMFSSERRWQSFLNEIKHPCGLRSMVNYPIDHHASARQEPRDGVFTQPDWMSSVN